MSLLGSAALLMWCEIPAEMEAEQAEWHSHEHIAERLALPGFLRARRGVADGTGTANTFMLYELTDIGVLTSPGYLGSLNNPTPRSTKMNQNVIRFSRAPSQTAASWGRGAGGYMLTIRYNAQPGQTEKLHAWSKRCVEELKSSPAVIGAHFFVREAAATVPTKEHKLRGKPDEAADFALLVEGYDTGMMQAAQAKFLSEERFVQAGAAAPVIAVPYRLVDIA